MNTVNHAERRTACTTHRRHQAQKGKSQLLHLPSSHPHRASHNIVTHSAPLLARRPRSASHNTSHTQRSPLHTHISPKTQRESIPPLQLPDASENAITIDSFSQGSNSSKQQLRYIIMLLLLLSGMKQALRKRERNKQTPDQVSSSPRPSLSQKPTHTHPHSSPPPFLPGDFLTHKKERPITSLPLGQSRHDEQPPS